MIREEIGEGWSFDPLTDIYKLNNGEFNITGDVIRNHMREWGRKIERVHILGVLNKFYRMSRGS